MVMAPWAQEPLGLRVLFLFWFCPMAYFSWENAEGAVSRTAAGLSPVGRSWLTFGALLKLRPSWYRSAELGRHPDLTCTDMCMHVYAHVWVCVF